MFIQFETTRVPIDRLFANLRQQLFKDTNSVDLTYRLGRLHAMAYSTNLAVFSVRKDSGDPVFAAPGSDTGVPLQVSLPEDPIRREAALDHLTNAIALYDRAIGLLKKSTNSASNRWLILPMELGRAWCLDQAGRREAGIQAYRRTLKIAWKAEVTGDFDFKEWAQERWDDVRAGRSPFHGPSRGHIGPGVCFSQETIGYLRKLLDPVKDAREIAELKEKEAALQKIARAVTPIIVPLVDLGFSDLVNPNAQVAFDLDGSGQLREWGWITTNAAFLVFDAEGRGQITSGLQMFGNVTFWIFWPNGYEALGALDTDGDGVLRGPELRGLALWRDQNGNGISEPGEVRPVGEFGVVEIACGYEKAPDGMPWNPKGVIFRAGKSRATYDWLAPSASSCALKLDNIP